MHAFSSQVFGCDAEEEPLAGPSVEPFTPDVEGPEGGAKHERVVELERPDAAVVSVPLGEAVDDVLQEPGWNVELAVDTAVELDMKLLIGE